MFSVITVRIEALNVTIEKALFSKNRIVREGIKSSLVFGMVQVSP